MFTIDKFIEQLKTYLTNEQINLVRRAYYFAEQAHDGQMRRTGESYITHPLQVASILADMHMDHHSLMAAMLHDVLEDTGVDKSAIKEQFGETIAELVDGVSKFTTIPFENKSILQAENFQKMALAMAKDIRVILVKLSDRLHNMRTLAVLRPDKKRRIARETLDIYVPIANRLGMHSLKNELEDLGFEAMYPLRSFLIKKAVKKARGNRKDLIGRVQKAIAHRLEKESLNGQVIGREKHFYSIYKKMRTKSKSFYEIMDVFAFRIIVDNVDSCYRVLGTIHNLYKPIPGRFKDYIAIPKANGYQSLHTTLFGMHGIPIEIQIKTKKMEDMANNGVAAHWLYKSGEEALIGSHARTRQWLAGVLELQKNAGDSLEFIENVKIDLFPDEVYVFSPQGTIFELPKGATSIDFAYTVHSDIGNSCVACRIDKRLSSLSQALQSGQTVEIITAKDAKPSASWLNFVLTARARSGIRHFLKNQKRSESITFGKKLLNRALMNFNMNIKGLDPKFLKEKLFQLNIQTFDDLLEDIGLGKKMAYIVTKILTNNETTENLLTSPSKVNNQKPLAILGTEGIVITFAKCCYPIPNDPIIGYVSSGRGIIIHNQNCNNVSKLREQPEKTIEVDWDSNVSDDFTVALDIQLEAQKGMVAALATSITENGGNIVKISVEENDIRFSLISLLLSVKNRIHLAKIIKRLRVIKGVNSITRKTEKIHIKHYNNY